MGNFERWEFACRCGCGFAAMDVELLEILEDVRAHFGGRPVTITGPNRCYMHNAGTVGASLKSYHTKGMAADFRIEGVPAGEVADYLEAKYPTRLGIGRYVGRTHVDVRPGPGARWRG